jgi:YHS domain-containing protein
MKRIKPVIAALLLPAFFAAPFAAFAAEGEKDKDAKQKPYPLDTCVVSGEKLGEMGKPYAYEYKGREIKFCCKDCVKDFNKDPDKYIKKLDEAAAKAKNDKK